jgi:hypothetical protein
LIELQAFHLIRLFPNRRQITPHHARSGRVVVFDELADQVVEMPLAEDDELVQAFPSYRTDESLAATIHPRRQLHPIVTVRVKLFV